MGTAHQAVAETMIMAILAALLKRLGDADGDVRRAAVEAVKALGLAAATPAFLAALLERLGDADKGVPWRTVAALDQLANRGVRLFKLRLGRWQVRTIEELSRFTAAP